MQAGRQQAADSRQLRLRIEKTSKMLCFSMFLGGAPADAWPEIALRFSLSLPGVSSAIVGTTKTESAKRNVEAWAKGPLPEAAVARIRQAFSGAEAAAGETWEGRR